ncbi:hypothetical protein GF312_00855 [Candidatus Poribacteria bacterium]|nr:hypothetical protein [Candidatus Poribacteria bacterium]
MSKRFLAMIFLVLFTIPLLGCGLQAIMPSKKVPPLEGYSSIVLMPFDIKKSSGEYDDLPTMLTYGIGTKLSVRFEDKTWHYDQSQEVQPVSDKLKELGISATDVYNDPTKASKVAEAFQADLIVVGLLEEPEYTMEESGKVEEDKSDVGPTGAARYYAILQSALLATDVKIIDPKKPEPVWDGRILGFRRYKTQYRTGESKKMQREETMLADVRRDLVNEFVEKLYPSEE